MSPDELKATLKAIGMSQREAARILRINERTMRRYVAGDLVIPTAIKLALYWVINESWGHRDGGGLQNTRKSSEAARQATRAKQVD